MLISIEMDKFVELKKEIYKENELKCKQYFFEALNIQEIYEIFVYYSKEYLAEIFADFSKKNRIENNINLDNFTGEKYSLYKNSNGFNIKCEIVCALNKKYNLGLLTLNNNGEILYKDFNSNDLTEKYSLNNCYENKCKSMLVTSLYTIGKILYNINNKFTIQKERIIISTKKKKVKKPNSRKRISKTIIVNKPCIVYTGEISKKIIQPKYNVSEWYSRGYWRRNYRTGEKQWIKSSVKKRKKVDINMDKIIEKEYIYE